MSFVAINNHFVTFIEHFEIVGPFCGSGAAGLVLFPGRRPAEGPQVGAGVAAVWPLHGLRHAAGGHRLPDQTAGAGEAATAPHH